MRRNLGFTALFVSFFFLLIVFVSDRYGWLPSGFVRGGALESKTADVDGRAHLGDAPRSSEDDPRHDGVAEGASEGESTPEQANFLSFAHRDGLNPKAEKIFVVSLRFSISPTAIYSHSERRIRLVSKYASASAPPFPGWVLAIRPLKTSVRPELYWQTSAGKGGWFTFDRFDLKPGAVYQATLVVKPETQMSLFMSEVSSAPDGSAATKTDGFVGGYSLDGIGIPQAEDRLSFASSAASATVSRLFVAQLDALKLSRKVLSEFVKRGPDGIRETVKASERVLDFPPMQPDAAQNSGPNAASNSAPNAGPNAVAKQASNQ